MTRQELNYEKEYEMFSRFWEEITNGGQWTTLERMSAWAAWEARAMNFPFDGTDTDVCSMDADPNKLPSEYWKNAPEWANWAAMYEDGLWYWFLQKPKIEELAWEVHDWVMEYCDAPPVPDWTKSLTYRPTMK
jgi:hypothetical protein